MTVPAWSGLLGDALALVIDHRGKTPKKLGGDWAEFGVPVLSAMHVKGGRVDVAEARCISEEMHDRWMPERLRAGDVLLTSEAPLGEAAYLRHEIGACLGQRLYALRADEEVLHSRFLYFLLRDPTMQAKLAAHATGTTVLGIRQSALAKVEVDLPDIEYQRQVASVLGSYDDLIENNRRRIEILEEMAGLVYREWFVHFRFPGHEHVEFVDSVLGPVPEGWATATLSDIASYINRGVAPKYDGDSPSLVINQRCIRDHRASLDVARRHITKVSKNKMVRMGDVLINSTGVGTLGRVAPVRVDLHDTTVDSHVTIVRPHAEINVDYFAELILSLEPLFESMGVGSTGQTELSRARVGETPVVLAPKLVRDAFGDFTSPMSALVANLIGQNEVLARARDLLLPRLISGQLDVSGLDLALEPVA